MIIPELDEAATGVTVVSRTIGHGVTRREAETAAVAALACLIAGDEAAIGHHADGSPFIMGYDGFISVSHSRLMAFIASHVALRIGIDAELPRRQLMNVASRFLAPCEQPHWRSQSALLRAWTIKEAVYKAAGVAGLPLADIRLPHPQAASDVPCAVIPDGRRFALYSRDVGDHAVTVAIPAD